MKIAKKFQNLICEMDKANGRGGLGDKALLSEGFLPDFATARNGYQVTFTSAGRKLIQHISADIHESSSNISSVVELKRFSEVVRQAVCDLYAENEISANDAAGGYRKMRDLIQDEVASLAKKYTHYLPAWTLDAERNAPLVIGPATIFSRDKWIDSVDFPERAKDKYLGAKEENHRWKENLRKALSSAPGEAPLDGLSAAVYSVVNRCPAVVKVTVSGYEKNYSRKLALIVARSALDSISLMLGGSEFFNQNALHIERLIPVSENSLIETEGYLWLPGNALSSRFPRMSGEDAKASLEKMNQFYRAIEKILHALVDQSSHKYPGLANRWATALDWLAEGGREKSDAIALTKIGTSLDVLSCGGKFGGILSMLVNLLEVPEDRVIFGGRRERNLKTFVRETYDHGRSKILHGNQYKRLKSFSEQRSMADSVARIALLETAIRLQSYSGPDGDTAFRTMPKASAGA